jgi:hypothetical protein
MLPVPPDPPAAGQAVARNLPATTALIAQVLAIILRTQGLLRNPNEDGVLYGRTTARIPLNDRTFSKVPANKDICSLYSWREVQPVRSPTLHFSLQSYVGASQCHCAWMSGSPQNKLILIGTALLASSHPDSVKWAICPRLCGAT